MNSEQLRALAAIVDHGTFEAAAAALHITASAVSQRIKALESRVGQVVLRRTVPCRPTEAGEVLLRAARQIQLLQDDAMAALGQASQTGRLQLAVNADSLATWFPAVLRTVAQWPDTVLHLHIEDQDHSTALLRSGAVIGAITSDPVAVPGCSIERLGSMRYVPMAAPALRERFGKGRGVDWAAMPMVRFNSKDDLQHRVLAAHAVDAHPPVHLVPSSEGFLAAVTAGLGWGAVPLLQLHDQLRTGALVRLSSRDSVDVPLYWQVWRLRSPRIDRVTAAVRAHAAAAGIGRPDRERPVTAG
ncbi:LysR family transcriptional regulator ArgP [Nakamurella lactea]|uniref:LysR family transcriptional regulator ArgP n=1 Tax=Nakamurella lactea TaxID=459515 RepID=UPI00040DA85D|nr:LysR family transcriptional regulator ArgP [Nakamurella lactea]